MKKETGYLRLVCAALILIPIIFGPVTPIVGYISAGIFAFFGVRDLLVTR